ncbi:MULTISPECIES: transglutaminase-like cysteine peptidase [unclassified Shinella]|jgi:predicted transglutaminase-like cysteine proteinase|uniref:transglutaminase-like cysteine peptidase n=1 Tax=unclassified Shinella TaxID=2643062 RepID=UPI0003C53498|nr:MULTISPECIES: transglutaminase-like cysteine peptidase [unclassified Shinella]MCA0338544.1 transglutaminase-like cysteine peptidase [Pseudomonadota bacterium]EYR80959.1 transglutaminase family protein cysteine peptidase BTLCP [Shinella sp. DD12]KNY16814.1 transglutaminase [Shinella sp. SUS2]KOC73292.1 transglutaminase [Shinella sp. GWS1]MCO5152679.1 transglutaminase-like cysteine peptidase [Shinella sp.]
MTKTIKTGTFAFLFSLAAAGAAMALPANIPLAGATNQPIGHYEFCKQYSDECGSNGKDAGPLTLTQENWKTILNVNFSANTEFAPLTDMEIYGVEEQWTYPNGAADCEDYVLIKRKRLMEAGISPSNLLITVVLQPNGEGHAVLTVRTDRGDFVLDNMRNKVLLWSQTEYRYLKRQSSANAGKWVKLQDGRADAVGSVK